MKILFTGGGSGGHFYPIIAVTEEIEKIVGEKKLVPPKLYYMAESEYDPVALFEHKISFIKIPAGKRRIYSSLKNFTDYFKAAAGIIKALYKMFSIYPDIVFGKGGFSSFPALFAARILRVPVFIHESDSVPGRVNIWAGRFAMRVAVSFPEAATFFPSNKTVLTGNPVRKSIAKSVPDEVYKLLRFNNSLPVILVLEGSQGSEMINGVITDSLLNLLPRYQIIHQTGKANLDGVVGRVKVILGKKELSERYKPFDFLKDDYLAMAAGASSLIISRAGSTIFEIAFWGIPSIVIPITDSNGDHQRKNAYNYARAGASVVIEEANLNSNILCMEINRLFDNPTKMAEMASAAKNFAKPDAAQKIAEELINISLSHEE